MRFDRGNLHHSFPVLLVLTLILSMPLVLAAETADPTLPAASPQQVVEHALAEMQAALFHRFALKLLTLTNSTASARDESGGMVNITFLPAPISNKGGNHATVHTRVLFKDAENMRMNYRLRNDQGVWKICDVAVDGISFVKLMQASVSSVVRQQGIDGLISLLEQKVSRGYP